MVNRSLRRLTKHLALAARRLSKEPEKKEIPRLEHEESLIERKIPRLPLTPKIKRSLETLTQTSTQIPTQTPTNVPEQTPIKINFGKIDQFLLDPAINIIECPGPDKKIKVKRQGKVMETNITLNSDEISEIISNFSKQTNAPLTQLFRAKLQNLSITAFLSPIAGTKFMVVKE